MADSSPRTTLVATGLNAVAAIVPQLVALLTLDAAGYGQFSMVYLVYAAGSSGVFSVIADAWSRTWAGLDPRTAWHHYSSSLAVFSSGFGLVGLALGFVVGVGWVNATVAALAVGTLVYRTGARYFETRVGDWGHVVAGDLGNIVAATGALIMGRVLGWEALSTTLAMWAAGSVAATAFSRRPSINLRSRPLRRWVVVHRKAIRTLLADSFLMDLGAIGTPYLVAPLLGLGPFGIYRAVANVAIPVQLVLNPLRPVIMGSNKQRLLASRLVLSLTAVLVLAGLAAYLILTALPLLPFRLGVISDLHSVALPAALFVPANGLSFYFYLIARGHASSARIGIARVAQTVLAIAAPVAGAVGWGLEGAVWGFSGSALAFVAVWWLAVTLPPTSGGSQFAQR